MPAHAKPLTAEDPRHGSNAGYKAHRQNGEEACVDCTTAHRVYVRDWRRTRRLLGLSA